MDVAVNLVETYLRFNGYLTLSEFEVQGRNRDGTYRTLTDVDIVALRFPGDIYAADVHQPEEARLLLIDDPGLQLQGDEIDVIIGEVKQGEAVFNVGLTDPRVLHTVLGRIGWIYGDDLDSVTATLSSNGVDRRNARGGATVRTRLVAFGRSNELNLNKIPLSHIVAEMTAFMSDFDEVLRSANFKDPVPAFLRLLTKTGFSVEKGSQDGS